MTKLKTFTKKEIVQELIDELQELVDCVKPASVEEGLCNKFNDLFLDVVSFIVEYGFLEECFKTWENFSGVSSYPVPHHEIASPEAAYRATANEWAYDDYGMSRRDLTEHVIECLEEIKELY